MSEADRKQIDGLLDRLCEIVEAGGGVRWNVILETFEPLCDLTWTDLAEVYMAACHAYERQPKIVSADIAESHE